MTTFAKPPSGVRRFYDPENKEHYLALSRRRLVGAGAALAVSGAIGGAGQAYGQASPTPPPNGMCVLTPETTEGPYYLDDMLLRRDITDGKAGVPLELTMLVIDSESCAPIANAAVDVWHCDALGFYSGFVDNSPGGVGDYVDDESDSETFLRGLQLTDENGYVTFDTIYPGWYAGRAIHIHLKVALGGEADNGTYDGGNVVHTGQIAFDDAITDEIALIEPYASKTSDFTRLEEDGVFVDVEDDDPSFFVVLNRIDDADIAAGFRGTITLAVRSNQE